MDQVKYGKKKGKTTVCATYDDFSRVNQLVHKIEYRIHGIKTKKNTHKHTRENMRYATLMLMCVENETSHIYFVKREELSAWK